MNLIISSEADTASINLRDRLLEMAEWNEIGSFDDRTMWILTKGYGEFCKIGTCLITIKKLHMSSYNLLNYCLRLTLNMCLVFSSTTLI